MNMKLIIREARPISRKQREQADRNIRAILRGALKDRTKTMPKWKGGPK